MGTPSSRIKTLELLLGLIPLIPTLILEFPIPSSENPLIPGTLSRISCVPIGVIISKSLASIEVAAPTML